MGRLRSTSSEAAAVDIVFDALEALGFRGKIRLRLAKVDRERNEIVFRYGRGAYGELPIRSVMIPLGQNSLSSHAYEKNESVFADVGANPFGAGWTKHRRILKGTSVRSFMVMPISDGENVVALLSCDSLRPNDFSPRLTLALNPYRFILASRLTSDIATQANEDALTELIERSRRRRVLILGKDTGDELERLLRIREILATLGYDGVLVKEQPDIPELSNEDKVRTFAGLCRFVLIENTFPAGQIVECKICSTNRIVTAMLREKGFGSSFMVTDYFKDFSFMAEFTYSNDDNSLGDSVKQATMWAETANEGRRRYFDAQYPWRSKQN